VADDGDREEELAWLHEPAAAREVRVLLEFGDDVQLSPDARAALEKLMQELSDAEVSGYALPRDAGPMANIFAVSLDLASNKCGKRSAFAQKFGFTAG
jgi:hypothetical protein